MSVISVLIASVVSVICLCIQIALTSLYESTGGKMMKLSCSFPVNNVSPGICMQEERITAQWNIDSIFLFWCQRRFLPLKREAMQVSLLSIFLAEFYQKSSKGISYRKLLCQTSSAGNSLGLLLKSADLAHFPLPSSCFGRIRFF